jgi:hypothetical protein
MIIGIIRALIELAVLNERVKGNKIEPPNGKTWQDCYVHYEHARTHHLLYHIKGDKSSHGISIEY